AEQVLVRAQGRGTFVAEYEGGRILFRFFRMTGDDGSRTFPESSVATLRPRRAGREARARLDLAAGASTWVIERTRRLRGRPVIVETIVLPAERFPRLDAFDPLPNNIYALYASRFGLTIGRVKERLKAIAASAADAAVLG